HSYASRVKTTFCSFGMQMGLVAVLVALPVIFPMALPLVMPPSVKSVSLIRDTELTPSRPNQRPSAAGPVNAMEFRQPGRIPDFTNRQPEEPGPNVGPVDHVPGIP